MGEPVSDEPVSDEVAQVEEATDGETLPAPAVAGDAELGLPEPDEAVVSSEVEDEPSTAALPEAGEPAGGLPEGGGLPEAGAPPDADDERNLPATGVTSAAGALRASEP